ncbi:MULTISPECIES: hypothetical protein [Thermocrispum]|jgi:hypothetical protein|uniref:Uncharacterized protein n=1 Tax=Thermocrispum agreste TaxID=37925 RepID=A0A2W4J8Q6_9PSEU|nr:MULTISPECIES: hypothetical protein [Thermocrispum]PZM95334.1 MAG: hypothetical protein DIU77_12575 [Thermocrispum agreste]
MAGGFSIDLSEVRHLAHTLEHAEERMTRATDRLRDASCSDLGHPRLDRAAEAFQDDWEDGIDEIGDLTGDIVEGLRKAIRVYRELDESIRDTFGGGQQGYVAGAGPDPGDSIIARRLEGE